MEKTPVLFYQKGTCALGALISLIWLGKPFRLCRLEGKDNEDEDYLKLNAMGEVPTLFLDGTILTENVAVLEHIALQDLDRKLTFAPGGPQADQMNRVLGFLTSSFHKSFYPVFSAESLHPDKKVQEEIKKRTIEGHLRDVFQHTEEHLLRTTYLFDHPMIGDAYLFAMARWGEDIYDMENAFPHIARFQKAMKQDPGIRLALQIEEGELKEAGDAFIRHVDFKTFVKEAAAAKLETDRTHGAGQFTHAAGLATHLTV